MTIANTLIQQIESHSNRRFELDKQISVSGGCINQAKILQSAEQRYFVKFNDADKYPMFQAEAMGLEALGAANAIRIPGVIGYGTEGTQSWLILEYIQFSAATTDSAAKTGRQLAELHSHTADKHGWLQDNTIGSTVQINPQRQSWIAFWTHARLGYQIQLAIQSGFSGKVISNAEKLMENCTSLINHRPVASLLHGDLWSGNLGYDEAGEPVLFDPAVYYGDHETDLAMTELFGGFSSDFYAAYREIKPIDAGYKVRKQLYNLYHILNHMNIFGGSYESQAANMAGRLLAEI